MLREPQDRPRVREEHRRVEHVGLAAYGHVQLGVELRLADHGRLPLALRAPRRAPDTGVLPEQDHAPTYGDGTGAVGPSGNRGPDPALLPERMLHGLASRGRRSLSSTAEHKPGAADLRHDTRSGYTLFT
ncbi:hypothetical protein CTE05_16180 [Cellulomonas terrae]|uniref:Uncharacterized protein n=1 Tax=Cellulomonas terrae TaxID=311234 RepID=A0A511JJ87_9CELL|nr:hypothetical protein CTE05_16180 [Cellulomonas terrae]